MRKISSILIVAAVILTACKKDRQKPNTDGLQKVTFSVSGFTQTTGNIDNSLKLAAADTSVTNNVDVLYYMLFDSNGSNIHIITQKSTDPAFGTYTESLHAGNYKMCVAGSRTSLTVSASNIVPLRGNELFYKAITFTVGATPSSQNITLSRISSKFELLIKDKIPSNVSSVKITAHNFFNGFDINTESVGGNDYLTTFNIPVPAAALGQSNYAISSPPFLSNGLVLSVVIDILDSNGAIISERNLTNVPTGKNAATVFSGYYFGGNGGTGGGLTLSLPAWNTPITQGF